MSASTITGTVSTPVILGSDSYGSPLTITTAGDVAPTASGSSAITVPTGLNAGSIINQGRAAGAGGGKLAVSGGSGLLADAAVSVSNIGVFLGGNGGYAAKQVGGAGGVGVDLAAGGTLANGGRIQGGNAASSAAGGAAGGAGVLLDGGMLTNTGRILGGGASDGNYARSYGGVGVDLSNAATLSNAGSITGGTSSDAYEVGANGASGVLIQGATLINTGAITGGAPGGGYGGQVQYTGVGGTGVTLEGGTLVTSGTITGAASPGDFPGAPPSGYAVYIGMQGGTLQVDPGAVFNGAIVASGTLQSGASTALILAGTAAGTLAGLGGSLPLGLAEDFTTTTVDQGARWTLTGASHVTARATVLDHGVLAFAGTVYGAGSLVIAKGGIMGVGGAIRGVSVDFAGRGHLGLDQAGSVTSTLSGFGSGDVIDIAREAVTSLDFSGGVLTLDVGATAVAHLHFAGSYTTQSFSRTSNGHGGTEIGFVSGHAATESEGVEESRHAWSTIGDPASWRPF